MVDTRAKIVSSTVVARALRREKHEVKWFNVERERDREGKGKGGVG